MEVVCSHQLAKACNVEVERMIVNCIPLPLFHAERATSHDSQSPQARYCPRVSAHPGKSGRSQMLEDRFGRLPELKVVEVFMVLTIKIAKMMDHCAY